MLRLLFILLVVAVPLQAVAAETRPAPPPKAGSLPIVRPTQERITIMSIIPAQGEPGITVTLSGSGFGEKASIFLGSNELPAKLIGQKQLSFEIPPLAPGLYALFVRNDDGATSKTYSFAILPLKPVALSLSPDIVPACNIGGQREVTINGRNFQEGAQVLFDGGAIKSRFLGPETLAFSVPAVRGGMHQVQVKNPQETLSTPLALLIDSRPEIVAVTVGADYVNYYELNIEGRNFQQGTVLVVDGMRVSGGIPAPGDRDRLIYQDCTRLIYQRYPADPTPKPLRLQVVNPGNEESPVVTVSTP